ncbi:MAG: YgiT-type zinc finger protein [Planctomycetota bacterium]
MKFDACENCGGPVRERRVTVDLRRGERLYVFYGVPVGVCTKCGERYYPGVVLERLDELAEHGMNGKKLTVPTFDFAGVE